MNDIDPQDIDPDTGRPYPGYSSPSLDTTFHDIEMDVDEDEDTVANVAASIDDATEYLARQMMNQVGSECEENLSSARKMRDRFIHESGLQGAAGRLYGEAHRYEDM
jgi:hypothetical protein